MKEVRKGNNSEEHGFTRQENRDHGTHQNREQESARDNKDLRKYQKENEQIMKTSNLCQIDKQSSKFRHLTLDKMEAIAYGVQARFEENTGYSKRVTDATINVARALGVPEPEIESWANHRLTNLARETERLREIRNLLEKLYGNALTT